MSDPGYRILSARYANPERTAVVARTAEAGCVAASHADRPKLWDRILRTVPVAPYDPANANSPETASEAPGAAPVPDPTPPLPNPTMAASALPLEPRAPLPPLPPAPAGEFSISDLLSRAEPPDKETGTPVRYVVPERLDVDRRAMAKSRVMGAVTRAGQVTTSDQMRYELALQAKNENVRAMALFETEAKVLGITVADLVGRIIEDRRTRERRMMQVYAILARVSAAVDKASGPAIDGLAEHAIAEIAMRED